MYNDTEALTGVTAALQFLNGISEQLQRKNI
jgi:hypothetical protein